MQAISDQACKVLKLFGKDVDRVVTTVGPEQEYFLIKKEDYQKRLDLVLCGRTLFGSAPSKGQSWRSTTSARSAPSSPAL